MGVSLAVWGLARMIAPFLAIEALSLSARFCFFSIAGVLVLSSLVQWLCVNRLQPHHDLYKRGDEEGKGTKALIDQTYQTTI